MKKLNKKQKLIILIAIVTIIVIIGMVVGANAIRTNIINSSYESSNSGSNNGNLLPEYIKRGITLGGVTGTLEDLDTSDATATEWDITYGKTAYVKGKKIEGLFVPREEIKIGDYVSYKPDEAENYSLSASVSGNSNNQSIEQNKNLNWQILSINEDGTIKLVSDTVGKTVAFGGALGYNNSVYVLNDICAKQYSSKAFDTTARCMNLEDDIESEFNSAGISARNAYKDVEIKYGSKKTYTTYRYFPNLFSKERGSGINTSSVSTNGIARNASYYSKPTTETSTQAASSLTIVQDYYEFEASNIPNYFDDIKHYNLIFNGTGYWLATRRTRAYTDTAAFNLFGISGRKIFGGADMITSDNDANIRSYSFRAVVILNTNVQIYGGDGSAEHPYQLSA